jgi:hypothetical protein
LPALYDGGVARTDANWTPDQSRGRVHELVDQAARNDLVAHVRLILLPTSPDQWRTAFCRVDLARRGDPPSVQSEDFGKDARVRAEMLTCQDFLVRMERAEQGEAFVCDGSPAPGLFGTPWQEALWVNSTDAQAEWGATWPCVIASASLERRGVNIGGLLEGPATGTVDGFADLVRKVSGFSTFHGRRDARLFSALLLAWDYRGRIESASVVDRRLAVDVEPSDTSELRLRGVLRAQNGTSSLPASAADGHFEIPSDLREAQLELLHRDVVVDDIFVTRVASPLDEVKERVLKGDKISFPVRTVLQWFGAQRRGRNVVASVRRALDARGLATIPDFEDVWIDASVEFATRTMTVEESSPNTQVDGDSTLGGSKPAPSQAADGGDGAPPATPPAASPPGGGGPRRPKPGDPVPRILHLAAANRPAPHVSPSTPVTVVLTRMMVDRINLLLVNNGPGNCSGIVTWRAIATAHALGRTPTVASDCMENVRLVEPKAALLEALPEIARIGYAVVKNAGTLSVVTAADIIEYFRDRTEPFLLLGQIENRLRSIIDAVFSPEELQAAADPEDVDRTIEGAHNLSFGEYVRLLEREEHWTRCRPNLDRGVTIQKLRHANTIRNDVMHFDPDQLDMEALHFLQALAAFLEEIAR